MILYCIIVFFPSNAKKRKKFYLCQIVVIVTQHPFGLLNGGFS